VQDAGAGQTARGCLPGASRSSRVAERGIQGPSKAVPWDDRLAPGWFGSLLLLQPSNDCCSHLVFIAPVIVLSVGDGYLLESL
jgi:hypothetical protein